MFSRLDFAWLSQLSKSPNSYDLHVELIRGLQKLGELDQIRHAREAMHAVYPLTEGIQYCLP